jgi:hypothetical protein
MLIVTAHIKFGLHSNFLDSMLQAEDERLPGESIEDGALRVLAALERAVERKKKEAESIRGEIVSEIIQGTKRDFPPIGPAMPQSIPTISKDIERLEIAVDNATTLEELRALKDECWKLNIQAHYINKFNELNNGR